MLVVGRGPPLCVPVVDVQSLGVVRSRGILNGSGPLPLGNRLIIWNVKVTVWLKKEKKKKVKGEGLS